MDVRCEKCQTEYELDEARLKPGGVTVKCTNCGHMFKIRKRSTTNPGAAAATTVGNAPGPGTTAPNAVKTTETVRAKPPSARPTSKGEDESVGEERQWLIRLESGDQKQCKELATLQQWIVGGTVTREALISRNGKTWKRIGDIAELSQYFTVADEARNARQGKPTVKPGPNASASTMMGMGITAAGGTVLPDDDDDRSTGSFSARKGATTPPSVPVAKRPLTTPPPPPAKKTMGGEVAVPDGGRATGTWASADISPSKSMASMPSGPASGKLRLDDDEPAFAGKVRVSPSSDSSFSSGRVTVTEDDDDDVLPSERGSKGGALLVIMALLVMGAAAGAIYVFVIKGHSSTPVADKGSGQQPVATPDAAAVATNIDAAEVAAAIDAAAAPTQTPVDLARESLGPDNEGKLRDALKSLDGLPADQQAGADATKALIITQLAQDTMDRALLGDKAQSDKLKKDAKQMVLDASTPAQKAFKATPDDPGANLAMAAVLRLQGKTPKDIQPYLDRAKAKVTPDWTREEALGEALALVAANKLDDAKALLTPVDTGDEKLENTGDVRVRFRLAMIAFAQNKGADAKPLVDSVLATVPDHAGAKALTAKLSSSVANTDPMPTEEPKNPPETPKNPPTNTVKPPENTGGGGDSYDALLAKANKLAESNCSKAIESYGKALEQKPNGVEALTGMGYCHIDAKQFASAFSKFRAALAVSARYEPALWGIAEAYMQQGRKEQALEAVKAYMDVYPGAAKAQKALDRLGGATPAPTPPEQTPTTPTPAPTPTPPAPEGPTTTPSE